MSFGILCILIVCIFNRIQTNPIVLSSSYQECLLEHENRLINEGELVRVKNRIFKVENCQLQRAYQMCGKYLWRAVNVVCNAVDILKKKQPIRQRRFTEELLLTEACCDHACTVQEMARYCPE